MKYRRALTGAVLVPTFIFLSGIGLVDDAQAATMKASHSGSSKKSASTDTKFGGGFQGGNSFKNNFAKVGTSFKPTTIEQPVIESPASLDGGTLTSGSKKAGASSSRPQGSK